MMVFNFITASPKYRIMDWVQKKSPKLMGRYGIDNWI